MKSYKALLVTFLMLCASSVYAQEHKYFTWVLVKEAGKQQLIIGNIMNTPEEILAHMEIKDIAEPWTGKGEIKQGKVVWMQEDALVVLSEELDQKTYIKYGEGIAALKSFLNTARGKAIKEKFFAPKTEYIAANKTNGYMTKSLKAVEYPFKTRLLDYNLTLIQDILDNVKETNLAMGVFPAEDKQIMQISAKTFISTYEAAMLIEPSLNTAAYQKAKTYLEKITGNGLMSKEDLKSVLKDLAEDVRTTLKNAIYESTVVTGESDRLFLTHNTLTEPETWSTVFPYTVKDAYKDLKDADPSDVKSLLGENGLLRTALNEAISEMTDAYEYLNPLQLKNIPREIPDVETCSKILELAQVIINKLPVSGLDISFAKISCETLEARIKNYEQILKQQLPIKKASLDEILNNKTLGDAAFEELFGNKDHSIAFLMVNAYKKDPTNVLNAIRVLIVEKIRRRFIEIFNDKGPLAFSFSSKLAGNDYFVSSDELEALESVIKKLEIDKLKAATEDEKEKLEKYKMDLESIDSFEVK